MPKEVTVRRSFTVPQNIVEQVSARARLNRRSVNQEFVTLVEAGIDASVKSDLAIIAALTPGKPSSPPAEIGTDVLRSFQQVVS